MSSPYKTILVTGGAGFIGSNFIHYSLQQHPEQKIINLDSLTYAANLQSLEDLKDQQNYVFVEGDIRDRELVDRLVADVDAVVHFAAESHVDRSILGPALFVETNVLGTQVLLDAALKHKLQRFHHISTDEVFGSLELGSSEKFTEQTAYDPRSPYSASKAGSDHLVRAYGETYGLPYTLTNCSNNYGEYQHPEKFIAHAITNLLEGKTIPIYGDGQNVRDWLYVQDHCAAIDRVLSDGEVGDTYLIGGLKDDVSNRAVAEKIVQIMQADESALEFVNDRPGHDRRYAVDWSKIKQELDWEPTVTFDEGLERTINWYRDNQNWWKPLKDAAGEFFEQNYKK